MFYIIRKLFTSFSSFGELGKGTAEVVMPNRDFPRLNSLLSLWRTDDGHELLVTPSSRRVKGFMLLPSILDGL